MSAGSQVGLPHFPRRLNLARSLLFFNQANRFRLQVLWLLFLLPSGQVTNSLNQANTSCRSLSKLGPLMKRNLNICERNGNATAICGALVCARNRCHSMSKRNQNLSNANETSNKRLERTRR